MKIKNMKDLRKKHSVTEIADAMDVKESFIYSLTNQNRKLLELKDGGYVVDSDRLIKIKKMESKK